MDLLRLELDDHLRPSEAFWPTLDLAVARGYIPDVRAFRHEAERVWADSTAAVFRGKTYLTNGHAGVEALLEDLRTTPLPQDWRTPEGFGDFWESVLTCLARLQLPKEQEVGQLLSLATHLRLLGMAVVTPSTSTALASYSISPELAQPRSRYRHCRGHLAGMLTLLGQLASEEGPVQLRDPHLNPQVREEWVRFLDLLSKLYTQVGGEL